MTVLELLKAWLQAEAEKRSAIVDARIKKDPEGALELMTEVVVLGEVLDEIYRLEQQGQRIIQPPYSNRH